MVVLAGVGNLQILVLKFICASYVTTGTRDPNGIEAGDMFKGREICAFNAD
jgi:hypothetical protein